VVLKHTDFTFPFTAFTAINEIFGKFNLIVISSKSTVPYVSSIFKGSCVPIRTYTDISVLHSGIEMSFAKYNQAGDRIFLFFTVPDWLWGTNSLLSVG
jgi:hypothetical protein